MIRGKIIEENKKPPEIKVSLEASIHNRFDVEIIDSRTGKVKQKARAFNVICNGLWDRLAVMGTYFSYIHFGTGEGTPTQSDTSLFTFLGSKSATIEVYNDDKNFLFDRTTGVFSVKKYIKILENEYVGSTLTEVGIGHSSSSSSLCTHAMLQDMNGNKISIEKTETDIINIYATVYVYLNPLGYDNGSIHFDIVKKTYTSYCSYMHFFAGINNAPVRSAEAYFYSDLFDETKPGASVTGSKITFDVNTKKFTITFDRLPAASGNFVNGILRVNIGCWFNGTFGSNDLSLMCMNVNENSQWFSHTEIEDEAVGTGDGATKDFALKFPYASDVEVFVDGVQTTNFTVDYGVNATEILPYMEPIRYFSTPENHVSHFTGANYYSAGSVVIYYNPMYNVGIESIAVNYTGDKIKVEVSNDLSGWTYVLETGDNKTTVFTIPTQYQKYKYWKFTDTKGSSATYLPNGAKPPSSYTGKVLHFVNAPADGAVITANYKSKSIAKSENNVFDLTVEMQLGEYTG